MCFQTFGNYRQTLGDGFVNSDKEGVDVSETFEMDFIFTWADIPINWIAEISVFINRP
jgi:hypothetical protein